MFNFTSTKLRTAAARTQATAQRLLVAAQAAQLKAAKQIELATALEAKERVAALQLQAAAAGVNLRVSGDAFSKAYADRNMAEVAFASCETKVEEVRKTMHAATADYNMAKAAVEAAQAELPE